MVYVEDEKRIICKTCNRVVIKLVPMYDNDQKHTNYMLCIDCKRAIKKKIPIVKFKRDITALAQIAKDSDRAHGKREVVDPL